EQFEERRPDRGVRYYIGEQTPVSAATAALGALALTVLVVGTLATITAYGWSPSEQVAAAITSDVQMTVLWLAVALGAAAAVIGWAAARRVPTKPSREAAIAGIFLGVQAVALAAVFLWFRAGDVETFARNFFEFRFIVEFWDRFVRGAVNTVILALAGEAIGIAIGLVLAVFALSARATVRAPARIYINFFRGTPLLWQLTFFFFGLVLGLRLELSVYQVAILVLGLNAGAYSAEIFRAGIQSIERGQFEAARSLGMGYLKALRLVILPQAVRRVIPPLTNEFVILIKDTSLVSVLGLTFGQQELMAAGREIYSTHANATAFLGSAAGYLAITLPMIRVVTWLERRMRSGLTGIGA
ncbi:MAG: amino acid ABC transporter permease, partial [Actinobacteria bacterium]|nr:amino acid ABC transporter permease [Actinomycetota bacterium]